MWRSTRTGLFVAAAAAVLLVSGHLRGDDGTTADAETEVPTFSVEVLVSPTTGAMKIPPANPPSRPYTPRVRIRDSELGGLWSLPPLTMYAGDSIEEEGVFGPYRITCSVKIDDRGEMAAVKIVYVSMDGTEPTAAGRQVFAAHLPRSQLLAD